MFEKILSYEEFLKSTKEELNLSMLSETLIIAAANTAKNHIHNPNEFETFKKDLTYHLMESAKHRYYSEYVTNNLKKIINELKDGIK